MVFTVLSTSESVPGELVELYSASQASKNYIIQNSNLGQNDIEPWGFLIARIYVPDQLYELATIRSYPCYGRNEFFLNVLPELGNLNLQWCFYCERNGRAAPLVFWVE
jgi:hypothetical protein